MARRRFHTVSLGIWKPGTEQVRSAKTLRSVAVTPAGEEVSWGIL